MRIGICEDHPFTRSTLAASISHGGLDVQFECGSSAEAIDLAAEHHPDAMLIDLHLGSGPSGLDLARALRRSDPGLGLVFLTSFESPKLLTQSTLGLPSGSRYLIKKDIASIEAIIAELRASVATKSKPTKVGSAGVAGLTPRQVEVLSRLALGETNQEIATKLSIELKTVEGLISRAAKSLGLEPNQSMNQRVQMARAYLRATGDLRD